MISLSFVRCIQWSNAMCYSDVDDAELQAEIANHLTREKTELEEREAAKAAARAARADLRAEYDALVQNLRNLESSGSEQAIAVTSEIAALKDQLLQARAQLSGRTVEDQRQADIRTAEHALAKQKRMEDSVAREQAKKNRTEDNVAREQAKQRRKEEHDAQMAEAQARKQKRKQEHESQMAEAQAKKVQRLAIKAAIVDQEKDREEAKRLRRQDAGFAENELSLLCSACRAEKSIDDFSKSQRAKGELKRRCSTCIANDCSFHTRMSFACGLCVCAQRVRGRGRHHGGSFAALEAGR